MVTITTFDGASVRETREALQKHIQAFADQRGLTVSLSSVRYSANELTASVELAVMQQVNGQTLTKDEAEYVRLAANYGLDPDAIGQVYNLPNQGWLMRITGLKPSRPKYPVKAARVVDGKEYKLSVSMTKQMIASGAVPGHEKPRTPNKPAPRIDLRDRPSDDW